MNVVTQDLITFNLSKREYEIVSMFAKGSSSKQIATTLKISFHTVENYQKDLFRKFKAKNVEQLIQKARKVYWLE